MNDYLDRPLVIIIFGITGHLSQRKLLPALYHLVQNRQLPNTFTIVGVSRHEVSVSDVYSSLHEQLHGEHDQTVIDTLVENTEMVQLDMASEQDFASLREHLHTIADGYGDGSSRIYYLSIPAQGFTQVVHNLGATNHHEPFGSEGERPRLLIEKPFGYDVASAKKLIDVANEHFGEQQTFRIDHYLAKETAQNILTFRFKNPIFQSLWNSRYIEKITVSAHETVGIEGRIAFYEETGAFRDFLQSHLMQLLALVTMERPAEFKSSDIHRTKLRLLESIDVITPDQVATQALRGQYDQYVHEVGHPSHVETFARLSLHINNEQWRDTEVTIESGKALREKCTSITLWFRETAGAYGDNALTFRIQPSEGITLSLQAKRPGLTDHTETVAMEFDYNDKFYGLNSDAYERVIIDAVRGDQSLFATSKEVLVSWEIVENVLKAWSANGDGLKIYPVGAIASDIV